MLTITTATVAERYLVIRPRGELDASTVAPFRRAMADIADLGEVIIDLSHVTFIDSAGLGALIGGVRRSRDRGQLIGVACDRPGLTRILHSTGVESIVALAPSVDVAVAVLERSARAGGRPTRRRRGRHPAG